VMPLTGLILLQILMLVEQKMREDEATLLGTCSRHGMDLHVGSMNMQLMFAVMVRAVQFLRLADSTRLPVERTTLRSLLSKWGAFDHIGAGVCSACSIGGDAAEAIVVEPAPLESRVLRILNIDLDVEKIEVRLSALINLGTRARAGSNDATRWLWCYVQSVFSGVKASSSASNSGLHMHCCACVSMSRCHCVEDTASASAVSCKVLCKV
jgi:hypothetical protein